MKTPKSEENHQRVFLKKKKKKYTYYRLRPHIIMTHSKMVLGDSLQLIFEA